MAPKEVVHFTSHRNLRHRLLLSLLSGKSIRIDNIRSHDVSVGLREHEISLLRLVEKVTNGSTIDISVTGTSFVFHPGLLPGGKFSHVCHSGRGIGYYLQLLVPISPFCKRPLEITLSGITGSGGKEMTVDAIRTGTLPHLRLFGIEEGLDLKIVKRGSPPLGGGEVVYTCPVVKGLKTLNFTDPGQIKRIRGVAYSTRVSPQFSSRMVEAARGILNSYIPDIYLYTDVYKGAESGRSPGYGLTLVSQSAAGTVHCAETMSSTKDRDTPERIGSQAALMLLEELSLGGCIDKHHQWLVMLFMSLGAEDVGTCLTSGLSTESIGFLRDLNTFLGVRFRFKPISRDGRDALLLSCMGTGFGNLNRGLT